MSAREIPFAPWCKPREHHIGEGVYVTTTYGYHAIAALLYLAWCKVALPAALPAEEGDK